MAGDWTAIEHTTPRKPEIAQIAIATNRSRHEVLGLMVEFWGLVETQTTNGKVNMPLAALETFVGADGEFWSAVVRAGWIELPDGDGSTSFVVPRANHWLSKGAKARLKRNRKQSKWRAKSRQRVDQSRSTKPSTTEQNRTEQSDPSDHSLCCTDQRQSRRKRRTASPGQQLSSVFDGLSDADLKDTQRLAEWLRTQATGESPVIKDPQKEHLFDIVGAAEHALKKGRDPIRYFRTIVGARDFDRIPKPAIERAKSRVEKYLRERNGASGA